MEGASLQVASTSGKTNLIFPKFSLLAYETFLSIQNGSLLIRINPLKTLSASEFNRLKSLCCVN